MGFGESILDVFEDSVPGRRRRHQAWEAVAARRGGHYGRPTGGFFDRTKPSLTVPFGPVIVNATLESRSSGGDDSTLFTVVRARYLLGTGPRFRIGKATVFGRMGRALGLQDVPLGDPAFDQHYIVKTNVAEATRVAFGHDARDALRQLHHGSVRADGRMVVYEVARPIGDTFDLERAITIAGLPASTGAHWLTLLERIPGRHFGPRGSWEARTVPRVELDEKGVTVTFIPVPSEVGSNLVLDAALQRELPAFWVRVDAEQGLIDEPPNDVLTPDDLPTLRAMAPVVIGVEKGHVHAVFAEADENRLMVAARWIARIAEGSRRQGAFR